MHRSTQPCSNWVGGEEADSALGSARCDELQSVHRWPRGRDDCRRAGQQAPDPANTAPAHAEQERQQAHRIEAWSIAWMLLALVIWGWFAFLLLADYGPEFGDGALCRGPLVGPPSEVSLCRDPLRQ
ncbi:hypothetical protein GCM10010207_46490 [Streptomyces atratus]|nr:hypothetical protein GCM10010207_46490 [Streptomyces atratus]